MEHHTTKDMLHVMQVLDHENIKNTLVYTQLINATLKTPKFANPPKPSSRLMRL